MVLEILETPEEWAAKYKIMLEPISCNECKTPLRLTKPIAMKGYRGLGTEDCPKCIGRANIKSGSFRVVPILEEKLAIWESLNPH